MSDIPFLFTVAVVIDQEGRVKDIFPTVSKKEQIQERYQDGETMLGVFLVWSSMTTMKFFSEEARFCQSIAASFFEAGYQAGIKKGQK